MIEWYDAKKMRPVKNGDYLVFTKSHCIQSVNYSRAYDRFNCRDEDSWFEAANTAFSVDYWAFINLPEASK